MTILHYDKPIIFLKWKTSTFTIWTMSIELVAQVLNASSNLAIYIFAGGPFHQQLEKTLCQVPRWEPGCD